VWIAWKPVALAALLAFHKGRSDAGAVDLSVTEIRQSTECGARLVFDRVDVGGVSEGIYRNNGACVICVLRADGSGQFTAPDPTAAPRRRARSSSRGSHRGA
jgi:hypothetical protein